MINLPIHQDLNVRLSNSLKKGIKGMFLTPDPENDIDKPTIIINNTIPVNEQIATFVHELTHYYFWVDHKDTEFIADLNAISEMFAKTNEWHLPTINALLATFIAAHPKIK